MASTNPSVAEAFNSMFGRLEPSDEQRKTVTAVVTRLRARLEGALKPDLAAPAVVGGSFGRRTDLQPLNDVDVFFYVSPGWASELRKAVVKGEVNPGPAGCLEVFGKRITQSLGVEVAGFRLQSHSVGIRIKEDPNIWFDLVPLLPHPSMSGVLELPDTDRGAFILGDPVRQAEALKGASAQMGNNLHRYIRLVKRVNKLSPREQRVGSYHLEVMCYGAFNTKPVSFMDGFRLLMEHLAEQVLRVMPNPAGLGPHVDDRAETSQRHQRAQRFQELHRLALEAQGLEREKKLKDAHRKWRQIFGEIYKIEAG